LKNATGVDKFIRIGVNTKNALRFRLLARHLLKSNGGTACNDLLVNELAIETFERDRRSSLPARREIVSDGDKRAGTHGEKQI
jgi:hypothetical protein